MKRPRDAKQLDCVQCRQPGIVPALGVSHMKELVLVRMVRDTQGRVGDWGRLFETTLPCVPLHWANCLAPLYEDPSVRIAQSMLELPKGDPVFGWQYAAVRHFVIGSVLKRHLPDAYREMIKLESGTASTPVWKSWKSLWPHKA